MIMYPFRDCKEFKELFGFRDHGNGARSRHNLILLAYYKNSRLLKWVRETGDKSLMTITTMAALKSVCLDHITSEAFDFPGQLNINGRVWGSSQYRTDHMKGKTEDGDARAIRYVRLDTEKVYKMKAGKMYRQLILNTKFGQMLSEQVVTWLCEELSFDWCGYNTQSEYELHVDGRFDKIYSSTYCKGRFGSCMEDNDQYEFYENSVDAKAAYLTDMDGDIVARAIIFTDVEDIDSNEKFRLCERQYSSDGDEMLKQILVNRLIAEGHIDGYKRVGADCHSPRSFVDNHGHDLSHRRFAIDCELDYDDILSYQDTFKWYDMDERRAYNFQISGGYINLATTDRRIDDDRNYDDYHEEYTDSDLVEVYYDGSWINCSEDRLDDFVMVGSRYYHENEVSYCQWCEEPYVERDGEYYYSEITGDYYCCDDCMYEAEREYCETHPDEYIWLDGEAVSRDDIFVCAHCGEISKNDEVDEIYSELTEEYYCCEDCKQEAERRYLANNPDSGYAICSECDDVLPIEDMVENEDGDYICKDCLKYRETYKQTNLFTSNAQTA